MKKDGSGNKGGQKADARVLGKLLAAQNGEYTLSDTTHIADFFAETLLTIPGIASCRVCLEDVVVQKGEVENDFCENCKTHKKIVTEGKKVRLHGDKIECRLAGQPNMQMTPIEFNEHQFGFFILKVSDPDVFKVYQPFIDNVTNYAAISLENRLQRGQLQEASAQLERKVRERTNELKRSNELLEKLFSATEFLIAYLDKNFDFIRVNRAYAEADNRTPEFFVGRNHFSLYPNDENEAIFRRVVETGEPYIAYAKPFEYAEHPERGISYWNWTLQPVKEADGRVSGLVFTLIDVTERERAILAQHEIDERYRTLVEQASDGIFVADVQGNYIEVNPSGCAMLGYTREEILKLNMKDLVAPEDQAARPLRFDDLRAGNIVLSERTMVARDGSLIPVEISGKMLDDGRFQGIVRDITERRQHELEREAIITVANALRTAATRSEILTVLLDQMNELFKADGAMLAIPFPSTEEITLEMGRGAVGERFTGLRLPPGKGAIRWVMENRKPYLTNSAHTDPLFYRPALLGESQAVAAVPLIAQEQVIGALWIARKKHITDGELRLLNATADIAANAIHRVTLYEQAERQLRRLITLHQIDLAITTSLDLDQTLDILLNAMVTQLDVDAADILLLTPQTGMLEYAAGIGFRTRCPEHFRVRMGEGQAGLAAARRRILSIPDLGLAPEAFSRQALLAEEKFVSHYVAPLVTKEQTLGVLEVFTHKRLAPENDWLDFFETLATQAAIAIDNATLFDNLQRSHTELSLAYDATIEGWSRALDLRDKETEGHTQRVANMSLQLAGMFGMSDVEKMNLRRGALLHDIGKMGIPDSILLKPGSLTDAEWEIMRRHPVYAYEMLAPINYLRQALDIPRYHHERWDGGGYPHGLEKDQIPLAARIFAVVDVWDALTSDRPYRKRWSTAEALSYICEQSGKHFDPRVVEAFLRLVDHKDRGQE
ncbi:MAG: HD domain-containing phosphohydrolase [Chloroflexota bacterium]